MAFEPPDCRNRRRNPFRDRHEAAWRPHAPERRVRGARTARGHHLSPYISWMIKWPCADGCAEFACGTHTGPSCSAARPSEIGKGWPIPEEPLWSVHWRQADIPHWKSWTTDCDHKPGRPRNPPSLNATWTKSARNPLYTPRGSNKRLIALIMNYEASPTR